MVSSAFASVVSGVAALLVDTRSSEPSAFFTSHAQPEPNVPIAVLANSSLNLSNEPHLALIASANAPVGAPPPCGDRLFQKNVWFHTCASLLKIPPDAFLTISSSDRFSNSVPLIRLFRLVT